ncbi:MAG: hypothetical protein R2864_06855 [Syntrophotaleaceae bacterium]
MLPADKEAICIGCQHCMTVCKPGAVSILGLDPAASMSLEGGRPDKQQMELLTVKLFDPLL